MDSKAHTRLCTVGWIRGCSRRRGRGVCGTRGYLGRSGGLGRRRRRSRLGRGLQRLLGIFGGRGRHVPNQLPTNHLCSSDQSCPTLMSHAEASDTHYSALNSTHLLPNTLCPSAESGNNPCTSIRSPGASSTHHPPSDASAKIWNDSGRQGLPEVTPWSGPLFRIE